MDGDGDHGDGDGDGNGDGDCDGEYYHYLEANGFPPGGQSPVSPVQYSGRSQSPVACLQRFSPYIILYHIFG